VRVATWASMAPLTVPSRLAHIAIPRPGGRAGARARAALAAPGRLRQLVLAAAARRGVTTREMPARHLSRTCPQCGQVGDAHPRYAAAAVVTGACGHTYDQDLAAARLMLTRASSQPARQAPAAISSSFKAQKPLRTKAAVAPAHRPRR
jgi:transposase